MTNTTTEIRIYVACLAAYNNAILHGWWIDATQGAEHIQEQVSAMLEASPEAGAEEWAIHDYEGFEGFHLSEWTGFAEVAKIAEFIEEHGELGAEIAEYYCGDLKEAREALEERYCGKWDSLADYAEHLTEESGQLEGLPENLAYYIDFEAMGRDMEMGGDVITFDAGSGAVHIFWSH